MSISEATGTGSLVEQAFRLEYARLVARLAREFGFHQTERAEDAAQAALLAALRTWTRDGQPAQPGAWLYRVARNQLLDELRRSEHRNASLDDEEDPAAAEVSASAAAQPATVHFESELADDELRMLFVCADAAIAPPSQLVLALKVICGFSTAEIALRMMISEDNVQKRLARARDRLRALGPDLRHPSLAELQQRRDGVLHIIYLLFNEGYSSARPDELIRHELVDEAMRLAQLLVAHPVCGAPEAEALLALMYFHVARFNARMDGAGALLMLESQDRSKWDSAAIAEGMRWLHRSGRGERFSRYHAEAAVASLHCTAPSYAQTDWAAIVDLYETLERQEPSVLHALNRAIALAEWKGAAAGLEVLRALQAPGWLASYYLWDATLGELERRCGQFESARRHLQRALTHAPHPAEQRLIECRLQACDAGSSARH